MSQTARNRGRRQPRLRTVSAWIVLASGVLGGAWWPTVARGAEPVSQTRGYSGPTEAAASSNKEAPPESKPAAAEAEPAAEREPREVADPDPALPDEDVPLEEDEEGISRKVVVGSMFDGPLPRVAGSAQQIGNAELEKFEYDDFHRVVASVPGVYVRAEDGFGLRPNIGLRGANPDRSAKITLMEDGILMGPAPYSAPAAYYFPLTTRMTGVEVFKGPASVRFGPNTVGGAINLRTRDIPEEQEAVVDVAGGRYFYGKGHGYWGTTYKGFGVLLEAARIQTRGFKELDGGGDTGFSKNDAMIKVGYRTPSERRTKHAITLKGGLATEESFATYLGLSDEDFDQTPYRRYAASANDRMTWWRSQGELTYVLEQDEQFTFEARAYRHDFDRTWRRLDRFRDGPALTTILANPEGGQLAIFSAILRGQQDSATPEQSLVVTSNARRFVSQGVQSAVHWRPKWKVVRQDLELGARLHNDSILRNHTLDGFSMNEGALVPDGVETETAVRNRGEAIAGAFHLHDAVTLWDRFTVAPGMRVEVISTRFEDRLTDMSDRRLDTVFVPGLGLLVDATRWLSVFGGVHRGFSPVAPGQARETQPEFSINYELGTRALYKGLQAEAIGFFSDYSNLSGACTFSSGCDPNDVDMQFNAGNVFVYGLESLVRYRHGFKNGLRLSGGGQYTYTGSRFREDFRSNFSQFGDVEAGDQLPYVPVHLFSLEAGAGGRIWDVSARLGYTGEMRDVAGQGEIPAEELIDGFLIMDLSAEVRVRSRLRFYGLLNNATNNVYATSRRPFGIRPGAPLTFIFGAKGHIF